MSTFAILHEPASYTVDRNRHVYDPMGIRYAYMYGQSEAKSGEVLAERPLQELSLWRLVKRFYVILRDNETVIVNGYTHRVFIVLFLLNLFYGRALGIDSDTPLAIPSHPLKRIAKKLYLGLIFRNRHMYGLAGGTGAHKDLFRHYGMQEERIFLMPMMVDNERFRLMPRPAHALFTFLYVGRIVGCKNLEVLFHAFLAAFGEEAEEVQLLIVGGGELDTTYRQQYGQQPNIHFLGRRFGEGLLAAYQSADVFILPSSYEPWGLVVNEAMAAGLPVIVSDQVGAAHDLVEGHDTGGVFPCQDVDALARQMKRLAEDEELRLRMANNAYARMHEYWNYDLYTHCLKTFIDNASQK